MQQYFSTVSQVLKIINNIIICLSLNPIDLTLLEPTTEKNAWDTTLTPIK